jgi:hypothetical protein
MANDFSDWERHLLSEHHLRERTRSLGLAVAALLVLGIGCAAGLIAGWNGVELSDLAWDLLWIGMVSSFAGAVAAWREWGHLALLRKLKERISELESQLNIDKISEQESMPTGDRA